MAQKERAKLLVADPKTNRVFEHPTLELALENGLDLLRPGKKDLIAIPEDWDLMAMQDTVPIGYDPDTGKYVEVETFTDGENTFVPVAVAIHPPPGYVRTHHPAARYKSTEHPDEKFKKHGGGRLTLFQDDVAEKASENDVHQQAQSAGDDGARAGLPLWAYTPVGFANGKPVAALFLADETSRWAPELFYQENLDDKVAARLAEAPNNPVIKQLADCATNYLCCCAQNVFYERWEGAVPIAPACTAACLGCLSKDPEWDTPVPQKRLKFKPKAEDIAEIIAHHLERAPEAMMSFGQGCEGEPTMNHEVIVGSVRLARERTKRGIININTNGSRPQTIDACAKAGASALRISINTFDREMYTAYYRPADYGFDDVMESFVVGRDNGMHISVNLLIWPGWTDRMDELEKISKLVDEGCIQMIQLRNLCVDPGHYRTVLPPREERGLLLGMRPFVDELHRRHPKLRFGTFNPRLAAEWYEEVPAFVSAKKVRWA